MNEELIEQIRINMEQKSTEELLWIWQQNNRQEWSDEAFTVIRHILESRGKTPGPQTAATNEPTYTSQLKRPGCITATALFISIIAVAYLGRAVLAVLVTGDTGSMVGAITTGVLAGIYLLVARGLWQLKNWARIAFIVLNCLGIILIILIMISLPVFVPGIIGLVISGYIVYWFASHGESFH